jgi:hypothetical protein
VSQVRVTFSNVGTDSENPSGADNQQERPVAEGLVVGFVDGEGCFSVALQRNAILRSGWQCQPRFSVSQSVSSIDALRDLQAFFRVGAIYRNRRRDNHRNDMASYQVIRRSDLLEIVIPFFEDHPLRTAKRNDFKLFAEVVRWMESGRHLTEQGLAEIARLTEQMNRRKPSRYLESSETGRRPSQ